MTTEEQAVEDLRIAALAEQNAPKRYAVLRPILHGTKRLTTGDVILFTAVQAQPLLQDGAIAPEPIATAKAEVVDLTPSSDEAVINALVAVAKGKRK